MEEDNSKAVSLSWIKHLEDVRKEYLIQQNNDTLKRTMGWRQAPYVTGNSGMDPYEATEEEKPTVVNMNDYIHKDEMVQILLDSRHALFTDKIPSVLEVIEWIEERKKQQS